MNSPLRLLDYLGHMQQAAQEACSFVEGLEKEDFLADRRTQQAVVMSLVIVGEAATKVMDGFPDFVQAHPEVPWRGMRGMRTALRTATSRSTSRWCGTRCTPRCRICSRAGPE
jgi:uncharacterized protein with HEPN domain